MAKHRDGSCIQSCCRIKPLASAVVWLALVAPAYVIAGEEPEITVHATRQMDPAVLVKRGDYALDYGDISGARRLFRRAALDRNADGAKRLGQTYDPLWLTEHDFDPKQFSDTTAAERWYEQALLENALSKGTPLSDESKREIYKGYIDWWIKTNSNSADPQ